MKVRTWAGLHGFVTQCCVFRWIVSSLYWLEKAKQGFPLFLIILHYSWLWRTDVCVLTLSQLFFPFGPPTQSVSTYYLHENKPSWPGIWMKVTLFFTGRRGHFVYFKWISLVRCLLSTRISLWVSRVFQWLRTFDPFFYIYTAPNLIYVLSIKHLVSAKRELFAVWIS